jgi:hypothetical protein
MTGFAINVNHGGYNTSKVDLAETEPKHPPSIANASSIVNGINSLDRQGI